MMSEVFWSGFIATASGLLLAILAVCYKSKCKTIRLCMGCVEVERDVELEERYDEREMEMKTGEAKV